MAMTLFMIRVNMLTVIDLQQAWFGYQNECLNAEMALLMDRGKAGVLCMINVADIVIFWILVYFVVVLVLFGSCTDSELYTGSYKPP